MISPRIWGAAVSNNCLAGHIRRLIRLDPCQQYTKQSDRDQRALAKLIIIIMMMRMRRRWMRRCRRLIWRTPFPWNKGHSHQSQVQYRFKWKQLTQLKLNSGNNHHMTSIQTSPGRPYFTIVSLLGGQWSEWLEGWPGSMEGEMGDLWTKVGPPSSQPATIYKMMTTTDWCLTGVILSRTNFSSLLCFVTIIII